jgi:GDPmannose 4,6-dehydratase
MNVALITGISGQDGYYLTRLLLAHHYQVHGIIRRHSQLNDHARLEEFFDHPNLILHYGDMTDGMNLTRIIKEVEPDEIYNLAAQSHVAVSFETAEYTANSDALGTLRILEAIRLLGREDKTKFYQASTSELFGSSAAPQNEQTPFHPRSPYAAAKLYSYWVTKNYREAYNIFAVNGILFNHESPFRGETFITKKVTEAVAKISKGKQDCLYIGNMDSKRDWSHASDFVLGMKKMMDAEKPDDYVLASGKSYTVRKLIEVAFGAVDKEIRWEGEGIDEVGVIDDYKIVVSVDPKYYRPLEVDHLQGDYTKALKELDWEPKIGFHQMIEEMVLYDLEKIK